MKKAVLFVSIICFLIGAAYAYPARSTTASQMHIGELLTRVFAASGGQVEGYFVHNWSIVNHTYMPLDELAKIGQNLNASLGIPDAREYKNSDGQQHVYQLHGQWDTSTAVSLILTSMNLQQQPQTVLVIKIEREASDLRGITDSIEKVKNTAAQAGVTPQISACIKGFRNDKIDVMERNSLIQRMFASVDAREVEAFRSDWLASVSGYSPLAKEYISTNGKRMNLQVAVHHDAYQKKTRILVGSPIVTIEY